MTRKEQVERDIALAEEVSSDAWQAFESYRIGRLNELEKDLEYVSLRDEWLRASDKIVDLKDAFMKEFGES